MSAIKYFLSLGSNIGDRRQNLDNAISFLKMNGKVAKVSFIYETAPVDMAPGTENFYNLVLMLKSDLAPGGLLKKIKEFEKKKGRDITDSHKRPRIIDIDILLAGELTIDEKDLVIPHKEMHKRAFVLIPLAEISPDLRHPVLNKSAAEILQKIKFRAVKRI
jgi:2-amino-4-hydroxy-6-hydroxymethyldihydropteridine diphosphokinase